VFTTLRPHPVSRFKTLTVAAVDLTQLALAYAPGTADLTEIGSTPALPAPAGLVPAEEQSRLVAVMNASWKPRHGRWGMLFRGVPLVPPRAEGCTLAVRRSGKAALGPWPDLVARHPELEARAPASEDPASAAAADPIVSYRQAPPCLVSRGAVANALLAGNDRAWGGNVPNLVTRRRSAVGLDATGTVLFYGLGEELEPVELARALLAAGAAEAAQLDINWYWTRFLVFGAASGSKESEPGEVPPPPVVVSTLVPGMEHQRTSYVKNASDRDFFYLLRR
jgi:hypothetical protein